VTRAEPRPFESVPARANATGSGPTDYASRVLDVAESIPPGKVMSYGDIAEYLGDGGPRQVGRVMALWGGGVPWWRVVHSDGRFLDGHEREALRNYKAERTPLRTGTDGKPSKLDMRKARWTGPDETDGLGNLESAADQDLDGSAWRAGLRDHGELAVGL
jgi:alkylated DNA nucleotide flippase Atl1